MLKTIEFKNHEGKAVAASFIEGSAYQLTGKRERFCQSMAQGYDSEEAYCLAYVVELRPDTAQEIGRKAKSLCHETSIVLRIAELKRPVLRKLQRKIEYNIQSALAQCQVAYDLAFEQGDAKGLLKAIEMQARLSKLLSEEINVNHRHGVLDDAATEVLLEMRKEIEVRRERAKKLEGAIVIEGEVLPGPG